MQDIHFELDESAKLFLMEKAMMKNLVPTLKRAVERYIEDALAESILEGEIKKGELIQVSLNKAKEALSFKQKKSRSKTKS